MFVKKTDAQLEAMSTAERDTYAAEKSAHEAEVTKLAIAEAVKEVKEGIVKDFDEKLKVANTAIEVATKANTSLEEIVKTQGEALAKRTVSGPEGNGLAVAENLKTQLEGLHKATNAGVVSEKVTIKVADSADTAIAVNTHNSIAGAIGAIGNYFAQLIPGFARKPVPTSNILDYVDVLPLDADRIVSISQTETVSILVTAECTVKPKSTVVWAAIDAAAEAVPTTFKTTTKMRRFFPMFVKVWMDTVKDYFAKKIPQIILTAIRANGTAFTAVPAQQTLAAPNKWDALVAVIASLIKLGYSPNIAKISVFAWEDMVTKKDTTGAYLLQNGGSINLLTRTVTFGTVVVTIEPDVELNDDELIVGDLMAGVKVGLDNNLEYLEYFANDDGDKNLKSHLLEKFIAVIMPAATRTGVTVDTFTNVITAITKP
jgi:predicted DNA-binding protein YlxM (UPF0122 family)